VICVPIGFFYAPPLFQYKGVTIYGIYIDDHNNNELRKGKYGWSKFSSDEGEDAFHIKDLLNYQDGVEHIELLSEAIDKGWLTKKGVVTKWNRKPINDLLNAN
jgi:hypothetical protein